MTTTTKIEIRYSTIPNGRSGYGFLPRIVEDGRPIGNTWQAHGYDQDVALEIAKKMAEEAAERYCGDYSVTVSAG